MDALLETMLDWPDLVKKMDAARAVLAREHERRMRFYEEMTESQKTEFINGQVVMHSPAKWRHIGASDLLFGLLSYHVNQRKLGRAAHEKLLISLSRNDYEPDVCFFRSEIANGFTSDQMRFPAPDFIAEVLSPSTESNDRRVKKRDYAAHGVKEYWIIDADAETVEQYALRGEDYSLMGTWAGEDIIASTAVAGFRIPVHAIFDATANVAALNVLLGQANPL